ncbi:hypothetical protein [Streptomyces atratus]|uniref:hypothetical protein n=1 Tax=Streptomyces atratus TaxID=1893 RepID=UPI0033E5223C
MAGAARFPGRVVIAARNAERLLESIDPHLHHGVGMTCVWRSETAACRLALLAQGLPEPTGPDESECRSGCSNLAYTDRNITELGQDLHLLERSASDPLAPQPLRDRAPRWPAGPPPTSAVTPAVRREMRHESQATGSPALESAQEEKDGQGEEE